MNSIVRKAIRTTFLTIGILVMLVIVLMAACFINAWVAPSKFKTRAEQQLKAARTTEDFEKAVGGLGVYVTATNGAWVAIAYDDSHIIPGWEKSVALTSGGEWFESEKHFCGKFASYRRIQEVYQEFVKEAATNQDAAQIATDMKKSLEQNVEIYGLTLVSNLNELNERLITLGFRKCE